MVESVDSEKLANSLNKNYAALARPEPVRRPCVGVTCPI